jgi:hypothetical protein
MSYVDDFNRSTVTAVETKAKRVDEYLADINKVEIPYIVDGLIYRECAHQLLGTIKAGKTTFTLLEVRSILLGDPFLGLKTARTNILYVTEQPRFSFQSQLREAGFGEIASNLFALQEAGLYVTDLQDICMLDWPARCGYIRSEATRLDAGLVIIDTFTRIALIENVADPGEANRRFELIAPITTQDGKALQLNWHERKAGGSAVEAGQGTVAYGGAVDLIIRLQKVPGQPEASYMRQIHTVGRFNSIFTEPQAIELDRSKRGYRVAGTVPKAKRRSVGGQILELLPDRAPGITEFDVISQLTQVLGDEAPAKGTIQNALQELLQTGDVLQTGKGYKVDRQDPHRYWINPNVRGEDEEMTF